MALAPRSSLRSLVLLMSHGKPRLSSFFSSTAATGAPPAAPGAHTPPATQPPAPPGRSCPKLPVQEESVLQPNPDPSGRGRSAVIHKPAQCTQEHPKYPVPDCSTEKGPVEEHPAHTTPGYGSCSTPEPVPDRPPCGTSEDGKQRDVDRPPPGREGVGHPLPDPGGRGRSAVTDEPGQCTQEHPKYPVPDCSSDKVFSSCSSAVPPPAPGTCTPAAPDVQPPDTPALLDRSGHMLPDHEESVVQPLPDPPHNRLNPVTNEPAQYTQEHLKYPTPESSSHKLPAHEELVIHPLPGGPRPRPRPRGAVKDVTDKACLNAPEDPTYPTPDHGSSSPSEDLLEDPRHPVRDPPRGL